MLLSLSVRDFVIVDTLTVEFSNGFTVLTGETGTGKSIILDALGLLLGDRADGTLVRSGQERAEISALFQIDRRPDIVDWLERQALTIEDDTLLIRRLIDRNGRSRNFINNSQGTLSQLRELGTFLVDIHGQHAHQSLVRPDTQRTLLDAYAGSEGLARDVQQAWTDWQKAKKARETAEQCSQQSELERERLSWQINEVAELNLQPDEWVLLNQTHARLAHATELAQSTQMAIDTLSNREGNCLSLIAAVQSRLSKLSNLDPRLTDTLSLLDSVNAELCEVVYSLRDYANNIDEDPSRLVSVEQRLSNVLSIARKYRIQPHELPDRLADWQHQLDTLALETDLNALAVIEATHQTRYRSLAETLSNRRRHAASALSHRITEELQQLAMGNAQFAIELAPLVEPSAQGLESVEYLVAMNSGTRFLPLAKTASGGELSRISLAMQIVISQIACVPTLIFDEVDVGVGGRIAEVIGKLLRQLGNRYQVLCITHLPQVASCGQQHWQVSKTNENGQILSRITSLTPEQRVLEIARMLGGSDITETTRQHAAEMLALNTAC